MPYIIYGINKISRDFLYVFDNIEVVCLVDDEVENNEYWGFPARKLNIALESRDSEIIIICDLDKVKKESLLMKKGLGYRKDYLYVEDFFGSLDKFAIPRDRKIAVWGTGFMAEKLMAEADDVYPDIYIETKKSKELFKDKTVYEAEDVIFEDYFIIVAIGRNSEVLARLDEAGLRRKIDYCTFMDVLGRPSRMLRRTIFDDSYYDLVCHTMLNHLEILNNGVTRSCCTTFVAQDMDSVVDNSCEEVWKSSIHKVMCLSIENRTYSFCNHNMCPLFVSKKRESKGFAIPDWNYHIIEEKPKVLALGYDPSCNLACATCRKITYFAKGKEKEQINRITSKIKNEYLSDCNFLILAGDGEVFACDSYRSVYESTNCNPKYIRLLTNGMLFTPQRFERLRASCPDSTFMMTVSIDAATKETYEKIRRNGNFDILKANMEYASQLRKKGELKYLRFNFVVQRGNYKEMPDFVKWGEELGIDEVFFTKILNWGTYASDTFNTISMFEEDGITPKKELIEVLSDAAIKESSITDLGTIQYSHKQDYIGIINNYYMWELEKRGGKIFL